MPTRKFAQYAILLAAAFVIGAVAFFLGDKYALQNLSVKEVAPDVLAQAMADDHFYSSYRENTLLIAGTINTANRKGSDVTVEFKTNTSFKALCDFRDYTGSLKSGEPILALTEAATAKRQPKAVLLNDCIAL